MNYIYAIDPGPVESALVILDVAGRQVAHCQIAENAVIRNALACVPLHGPLHGTRRLAIEMVSNYGMPSGASLFNTCFEIGRFVEYWEYERPETTWQLIIRPTVKLYVCNNRMAKDKHIRQALLDRYKPTGGGKNPVIGIKSNPGPLFGIKSHMWAALAVAHAALDMAEDEKFKK